MQLDFTKEEVNRDIVSRLQNAFKVEVYDELTSTFSLADRMSPYSVVLSLDQTSGRGRLDRAFYCEKGGIYMSICIPETEKLMLTTLAAGVAVRRAIYEVLGLKCDLKWVNDVKYNGKKVCGILTKYLKNGFGRTVTGIGINYCVNIPEFLEEIAASLTDKFVYDDFVKLTAAVIDNFCEVINSDFLDEYRALCATIGKFIVLNGKTYFAKGINNKGELIVEANGEQIIVNTGEIYET